MKKGEKSMTGATASHVKRRRVGSYALRGMNNLSIIHDETNDLLLFQVKHAFETAALDDALVETMVTDLTRWVKEKKETVGHRTDDRLMRQYQLAGERPLSVWINDKKKHVRFQVDNEFCMAPMNVRWAKTLVADLEAWLQRHKRAVVDAARI